MDWIFSDEGVFYFNEWKGLSTCEVVRNQLNSDRLYEYFFPQLLWPLDFECFYFFWDKHQII